VNVSQKADLKKNMLKQAIEEHIEKSTKKFDEEHKKVLGQIQAHSSPFVPG
jgi:hypothetical protein